MITSLTSQIIRWTVVAPACLRDRAGDALGPISSLAQEFRQLKVDGSVVLWDYGTMVPGPTPTQATGGRQVHWVLVTRLGLWLGVNSSVKGGVCRGAQQRLLDRYRDNRRMWFTKTKNILLSMTSRVVQDVRLCIYCTRAQWWYCIQWILQ